MSRPSIRDRAWAAALVAPLVLFLVLFFVWPLWTMVTASVVDDAVTKVLPRTAAAMAQWDGNDLPPPAVQTAFAEDLRSAEGLLVLGEAVRRLNSAVSGFRTLLSRTVTAAREAADLASLDLAAIDRRWSDPRFWRAIRDAVPPYTDRNLLAALDLKRDASGNITAEDPGTAANRVIMLRTFVIAGTVTLVCALIGLPYAMLAASASGLVRALLLLAVLLPLWTSLLVRTAAWFILLQQEGLINDALMAIGLIDGPLPLIFNRLGVIIAMTHVLLPFMVLPIYSVLIAVPRNLMPAAASLGAGPLRAFWRVLLPLAMPGLMSGCLLVFMVAIGYYITPALVGGANDQMISSVIAFYALGTANWGMAGALGLILLAVTLLLYVVYGRLSRSPQLPGGA
jgi:putative spermidine/putrescine transport system permease protein